MVSAATGWDAATPRVDWTVRLVMQAVPKSRCAAKTMRSAVTPAPEEGSKPAMVKTEDMVGFLWQIEIYLTNCKKSRILG